MLRCTHSLQALWAPLSFQPRCQCLISKSTSANTNMFPPITHHVTLFPNHNHLQFLDTCGAENTCYRRGMCTWAEGCATEKKWAELTLSVCMVSCTYSYVTMHTCKMNMHHIISHSARLHWITQLHIFPKVTTGKVLIKYICSALGIKTKQNRETGFPAAVGVLILRCDTQAGGLTFSARQQKDSKGIQREAEILHATLDLLFNYCFPASSSLLLFLPLSHTPIVWALFSPPPSVLLSLSPPLSRSLSFSLAVFCPTVTLSHFSLTGKSPEIGSRLDALPVRTIITCGSWHSNHISYALSLFLSLSHTHTSWRTDTLHSGKWEFQPWTALLAPLGESWPKAAASFTRSGL